MLSTCRGYLKYTATTIMWMLERSRLISSYVQGQSPTRHVREYFYFVDHQGQLFLHDARIKNFTSCFKEKKFLTFFFKRMKINETNRYTEFPYISPCGKEVNYIQCDDRPVVFTSIMQNKSDPHELLNINGTDSLTFTFDPEKICMFPETGRVYHPAELKYGGVGLVKSSLGIELSQYFEFNNGENEPPTHFYWNKKKHKLDYTWMAGLSNTLLNP